MALLFLEATGPKAEELALAAGQAAGIPVGYDAELQSATFDSDAHDETELGAVVAETLDGIDPDWRTHLRVSE